MLSSLAATGIVVIACTRQYSKRFGGFDLTTYRLACRGSIVFLEDVLSRTFGNGGCTFRDAGVVRCNVAGDFFFYGLILDIFTTGSGCHLRVGWISGIGGWFGLDLGLCFFYNWNDGFVLGMSGN